MCGQVSQGQELIEVLELAGVAAQRRRDLDSARRFWTEALDVSERMPAPMTPRVRARLTALG
jgi:hypothetical protein